MLSGFKRFFRSLGFFGAAGSLEDHSGRQNPAPGVSQIPGAKYASAEGALQISAVYACIALIADTIGTLEVSIFDRKKGKDAVAYDSPLYMVLHDQPNAAMTSFDFMRTMTMHYVMRGNAYAKIVRNSLGHLVSLEVMNPDQMEVLYEAKKGYLYKYYKDSTYRFYTAKDILHFKGLGNGIIGLSRLDFMRASITEMTNAQASATAMYSNGNRPAGLVTVDGRVTVQQKKEIKDYFSDDTMRDGSKLYVVPSNLKYQQLSLTPADVQLLESRKFGIDEIGRWYGVPSALINAGNGAGGGAIDRVNKHFYRTTIKPICKIFEKSIKQRVFTIQERSLYDIKFAIDDLLQSEPESRVSVYSTMVNNGMMTRNEVRRREGLSPVDGGDDLTIQTNLQSLKGPKNGEQNGNQNNGNS